MERIRFKLEDDGEYGRLTFYSLVDRPAHQKDFDYFNAEKEIEEQKFDVVSKDKRLIVGPLMRHSVDILRTNPSTGKPYLAYFEREDLEMANFLFNRDGIRNQTNINHKLGVNGKAVNEIFDDVVLVENWIVDRTMGKGPGYSFQDDQDIKDGDIMGVWKVTNDEIWNDYVKTGKVKGFSAEGAFIKIYEDKFMSEETQIEAGINEILFNKKLSNKEKYSLFKVLFSE